MPEPTYRKKLIEVDLPLDEINAESKREKSIRHGHPSTLHLWWARRPLAACRAVIFASMVDDPSSVPEEFPTKAEQDEERERLHGLIKQLVIWENTNNEQLINEARYEIARSVGRSRGETAPTDPAEVLKYLGDNTLPIYDPFAGGGSIPLEVQRLGLRAVASDLNPVAVLINKALIELPPKFANQPPVNPDADPMGMTIGKGKRTKKVAWQSAAGLADDVRYYGQWMRDRAFDRIGHLYPRAELPDGTEATVITWLWARTIPCPNPACGIDMPLLRTFQISRRKGSQRWIKPIVDSQTNAVTFAIQDNDTGVPSGTADRKGVTCVGCGNHSPLSYVRDQGKRGHMREQMTAMILAENRTKQYLPASDTQANAASQAVPPFVPTGSLPQQTTRPFTYGITEWHQLFTTRQLIALSTLSSLVFEAREKMLEDGAPPSYVSVVSTYLALAVSRSAAGYTRFGRWDTSRDGVTSIFARQRIGMVWDFAEANPFSTGTQNWSSQVEWIARVVSQLPTISNEGEVHSADASTTIHAENGPVIVTDPPYYDNIDYADLSDFFYVWLRPLLRDTYPDLFAAILTPKEEEMIAQRHRFDQPREHFEALLNKTLRLIRGRCSPEFPSSIFYAYKQREEERDGITSTGWDTVLTALVSTGFRIIGTWPVRTELANRANSLGANSLASSVVLVCRPRSDDAPSATRREFFDALEKELPAALDHLTRDSHIAPVDLAQAAIGPGMEIYSRFGSVETISGEPVTVREALSAINQAIADYDERQQGELDAVTRFCLDWLRQHDYGEGGFGEAEVLSQAKNVSIDTMDSNGLLESQAGRVRLRVMDEYDYQQIPLQLSAWEGCLRIGWHLSGAEDARTISGAAEVVQRMGSDAHSIERLARILYNHYDRKRDSANAVLYNSIVIEWPEIMRQADEPAQGQMFR